MSFLAINRKPLMSGGCQFEEREMDKLIKVLKAMNWTLELVVTISGVVALAFVLLFAYQNECDVTKSGESITVQCESES